MRNGCTFNPTARQFRTAYKKLLIHAGGSIRPTNGNCESRDNTSVPTVAWRNAASAFDYIVSTPNSSAASDDFEMPHASGCVVKNCQMCSAILAYIAGYQVRVIVKTLPCADCVSALHHSDSDPCPQMSLISIKSFNKDNVMNYNGFKGLVCPSGSVMTIVAATEKSIRSSWFKLSQKNAIDVVVNSTMEALGSVNLFPTLKDHLFDADGIGSHYWHLIKSVIRKFAVCRIKKLCNDKYLQSRKVGLGNKLQRTRIFMNT